MTWNSVGVEVFCYKKVQWWIFKRWVKLAYLCYVSKAEAERHLDADIELLAHEYHQILVKTHDGGELLTNSKDMAIRSLS